MNLIGLWRLAGKEANYATCPFCGHTGWKFYINRATGAWHCFAGRHIGNRGGVLDVGGMPWHSLNAADQGADTHGPKEVTLPILGKLVNNTRAMGYLAQRYITQPTIQALGLADWVAECRIFIPFVGQNGDILGYTGRDYTGTAHLKYRNSLGIKALYVPARAAGESAGTPGRPIVVVEGPLDAIACYQTWRGHGTVAAIGGKTCSSAVYNDLLALCRGRRVFVWLDADARVDAFHLALKLAPHVENAFVIGTKLAKDAAEMPPEQLAQFLHKETSI